jgi:alpha-L-fucosidase
MAPDIRWVGTETGYARESEWSVVPGKIKSSNFAFNTAHPIDPVYQPGDMTDEDLGSADKIANASTLIWYPAEADVSIRPGWFYHENQNGEVKTPEQLAEIYLGSVGRNAVLLLNVPPDKRGLIADADINSLMGMRKLLSTTFGTNLAEDAVLYYENPNSTKPYLTMTDRELNWQPDQRSDTSSLILELPVAEEFDMVMLQESMSHGQRIEKFRLETWNGDQWVKVADGTTVGYKRLIRFQPVTTRRIRLTIDKSRLAPTLVTFNLYKLAPGITAESK